MRRQSRWTLIWLAIVAMMSGLIHLDHASPQPAPARDEERLTRIKVTEAHITLNVPSFSPGATYYLIIGEITEQDGIPAYGRMIARGVVTRPRELNQLYDLGLPPLAPDTPWTTLLTFGEVWFRIFGREPLQEDTIIGSGGVLAGGRGAVIGGTGRFKGASGSYSQANLDFPVPLGTGTLEFDLLLE